MDEFKELEYKLHSMKVFIYTTCTQEFESIEKNKITDEEVLNNFFERISCLAEDEWFYNLCYILVRHGEDMVEVERTFEGIRKYLEEHNIEGLVFWKDGHPACKIKRSDFGFAWPIKKDDE